VTLASGPGREQHDHQYEDYLAVPLIDHQGGRKRNRLSTASFLFLLTTPPSRKAPTNTHTQTEWKT